jgi:hypothetical protein
MWKHARASLWAKALRAITEFVVALLRSYNCLGFSAKVHREVGCFDECPAQVWISVPGIAIASFLAVVHALAVRAPRIGGEVAVTGGCARLLHSVSAIEIGCSGSRGCCSLT